MMVLKSLASEGQLSDWKNSTMSVVLCLGAVVVPKALFLLDWKKDAWALGCKDPYTTLPETLCKKSAFFLPKTSYFP